MLPNSLSKHFCSRKNFYNDIAVNASSLPVFNSGNTTEVLKEQQLVIELIFGAKWVTKLWFIIYAMLSFFRTNKQTSAWRIEIFRLTVYYSFSWEKYVGTNYWNCCPVSSIFKNRSYFRNSCISDRLKS